MDINLNGTGPLFGFDPPRPGEYVPDWLKKWLGARTEYHEHLRVLAKLTDPELIRELVTFYSDWPRYAVLAEQPKSGDPRKSDPEAAIRRIERLAGSSELLELAHNFVFLAMPEVVLDLVRKREDMPVLEAVRGGFLMKFAITWPYGIPRPVVCKCGAACGEPCDADRHGYA